MGRPEQTGWELTTGSGLHGEENRPFWNHRNSNGLKLTNSTVSNVLIVYESQQHWKTPNRSILSAISEFKVTLIWTDSKLCSHIPRQVQRLDSRNRHIRVRINCGRGMRHSRGRWYFHDSAQVLLPTQYDTDTPERWSVSFSSFSSKSLFQEVLWDFWSL